MKSTTVRQTRGKRFSIPIQSIVSHAVVALVSFHLGLTLGAHGESSWCNLFTIPGMSGLSGSNTDKETSKKGNITIFPHQIRKLIPGASLIDRGDFVRSLDLGVPWDPTKDGNTLVFMLYSHSSSLPSAWESNPQQLPVYSSAKTATENCDVLKVVLTQPDKKNHCVAIVGQWESHHVQKFMRVPESGGQVSRTEELRYVSRNLREVGKEAKLPEADALVAAGSYGDVLKDYLTRLPSILNRLTPIARIAAGNGKTVVVMVCNFGQSELLFNFVCSAKARNLDLSQVLLFATDDETAALGKELGLNIFEVNDDFGEMPKRAARRYGDRIFAGMMMAKVYCVHLINMLGYDLLFQDVDVVWYQHPLKQFFDKPSASGNYDIYFQDDGARSNRYAPYSPNSGFYFVRHNDRTEYFFSVFARMGDLILQSGSHQSALNSILCEHASWRGLKVKVFGRDDPVVGQKFPGGFHYHQRREFMRRLVTGKSKPYIFHMSWTKNKDNKRKFFQQMGDWFLKDECVGHSIEEINGEGPLMNRCCLAEAEFMCHYQDKPSKNPCKDSPNIDRGRRPFW